MVNENRPKQADKDGWSRRRFLKTSAIAGGALFVPAALAACGGDEEPGTGSETGSPGGGGGAAAGTTIAYNAVAEPISEFIRDEMVPDFTEQTGIEVQVDTTDYVSLRDTQVLELQGDRYDVYQVDQVWLNGYVNSGYLEPVGPNMSGSLQENFYSSLLDICEVEDQIWTLPLSAIPVDYFYRQDVLDEAGLQPADTWDDVLTIAQETMNRDQDMWGFAVRGERGNPITWTWLPMFWAWGGEIFDENMEPVYNNAAGVESVEFFRQLNETSPPGFHSAQDVAALMTQDRCSQTTLMSVYNEAMNDPEESTVAGNIAFGEMPRKETRASILGMWTIGIGANSTKKDAAWQFIQYLSQPENAEKMALAGVVGATQPAIYQAEDAPEYFSVLDKVLEYVKAPPLIAEAEEFFQITGTELQNALSGEKTPQAAMDAAASELREVLAQAGYYD